MSIGRRRNTVFATRTHGSVPTPEISRAIAAAALVAITMACETAAVPTTRSAAIQDSAPAAWDWTMERITETVNAARAGRSLRPDTWPDGARVAVLLSFDVDNETVNLRFGQPSVGELSQGQYGARQGLRRVVELLDRHQIPASFFIPAISLRLAPHMAETISAAGHHEFAVHGWIHEMNTSLDRDTEKRLLEQAMADLERMTGYRPVGYRAPSWNFSANTLSILRELGFLYDSSLMADDDPYEIDSAGQPTGIVELPVEWILDEAPLVNPRGNAYTTPRDLAQVWIDEFDAAYEERGMFILTTHPHLIGHRSRIVALELLVDHIRSKQGVWFATHRAAAEYVKGAAPPG
jgi:peptidoglycan/xylan/chitin deacetylase (PgdA/CDA1 family)